MTNKHYRNYYKKKQKILKKYPKDMFAKPTSGAKPLLYDNEKQQEQYRQWCKDILDLLFEPDGDYQKFTWDIMSDNDKETMERKARGRKWSYNYD
jgi:hypothetical protein